MKRKYLFVTVLLLTMTLAGFCFVRGYTAWEGQGEKEELLIVTSFYPMYIAAFNIAGDCPGVTVMSLSEPQTGCLHDYQLSPSDMVLLSEADIFIINGGGMESFLTEVAAEYPNLTIVNAGAEIFGEEAAYNPEEEGAGEAIASDTEDTGGEELFDAGEAESHNHSHGDNAHVWMSISYYEEQVFEMCQGLKKADPSRQQEYQEGASAYLEKIHSLSERAKDLREQAQGVTVALLHEAFAYLAEDYGFEVAGELNLDEERQVSAGEVADLLTAVRGKKVRILLAEDLYGRDLGDTIEKETECRAYYLNTLVRGPKEADSWLEGMEENLEILEEALKEAGKWEEH